MTLQTSAPLSSYSMSSTARSARELARIFAGEDGDLSPEYQRGSVWTTDQRRNLVRSWLMGVPIPSVVANDRLYGPWPVDAQGNPVGYYAYAVIDGKQRIETAIQWFEGALSVPASWFPREAVESTVETEDGTYVYYSGLNSAEQRVQALRFQLPLVEARVESLQQEAELYLLLNGEGTPQASEDMANAAEVAQRGCSELR